MADISSFLNDPEKYMNVKEVEQLLRKSEAGVRALVRSGALPAVKSGSTIWIHREDVMKLIVPATDWQPLLPRVQSGKKRRKAPPR